MGIYINDTVIISNFITFSGLFQEKPGQRMGAFTS